MLKDDKPTDKVEIKINFQFPENIKTYFADNFVVQHQNDHFILSFYEVLHPVILGSKEERTEQLKKIKKMDATCVSRIIVTPEKLKDIISILTENYDNFQKKQIGK